MITTTLNRIRAHRPCEEGWTKLLAHLGKTKADDEPLPFPVIVESSGLDDALWCLRAEPQHHRLYRLFAVWCARQVQHLMTDQRSVAAVDVAERHANGLATDADLAAAGDVACGPAWTTAMATARTAAWDAARATAQAAARDAARAAGLITQAAARDAAQAASREAQRARFLEIVS